jgi:hypothetical protein
MYFLTEYGFVRLSEVATLPFYPAFHSLTSFLISEGSIFYMFFWIHTGINHYSSAFQGAYPGPWLH